MRNYIKIPLFISRLSNREYRALTIPGYLILAALFVISSILEIHSNPSSSSLTVLLSITAISLLTLFFLFLAPDLKSRPWFFGLAALVCGAMFAAFIRIIPNTPWYLRFTMYVIATLMAVTLGGKRFAYLIMAIFVLFAVSFGVFSIMPENEPWQLVGIFATLIPIIEITARLERIIDNHLNRLSAIYKITRNITSTLELDELFKLLNDAFHESIPADTHFLGLVKGELLHLDWFFDEDQYFPAMDVPLKGSISSWIISHDCSLLIRDFSKEGHRYRADDSTIGKDKISNSWIGAPLRSSGKVIGIIALASYSKNAFSTEDLGLLESVAQQASLVIENAYHHADAVDQSHRDSLTQVLNHGYFIERLHEFTTQPATAQTPASLIMLDVDYFKPFNDTYGHQAGDLALVKIAECIRKSVRNTDFIGRWGGEEFVILLPGSKGVEAYRAAERILRALGANTVPLRDGKPLMLPTASMGIAMYPAEAKDLDELILLADQRLYQAKERGRNQIEPQKTYWLSAASANTSAKAFTVSVTEESLTQ